MATKKFEEFINEAYVSNEKMQQVKTDLKREFPEFKFSIRKRNYSSVDVAILRGPIKLTDDPKGYEQVNHYYIKDHYKDRPEVAEFLQKVSDIMEKDNSSYGSPYDDYGLSWSFYTSLSIGDYGKPYQYIPATEKPIKTRIERFKQEKPSFVRQKLSEDIKIYPYKTGYVLVGLGTIQLKDDIKSLLSGWYNKFFTNPNSGERFQGWAIRADKLDAAKELTGVSEISEW